MAGNKTKKSGKNKTPFENNPTPERLRQAGDEKTTFKTDTGRQVFRLGSILDYMLGRGQIDGPMFVSGQTAYNQWRMAGFDPLGSVDLSKDRVDCSPNAYSQDRRAEMARKFGDAMRAIGPTAAKAFASMVCREMTALAYGRDILGYKDRATATNKAYSQIITALHGLEIHYTGGKYQRRPQSSAYMAETDRPKIMQKIKDRLAAMLDLGLHEPSFA